MEVERRYLERIGLGELVAHPDDLEYIESLIDVERIRGELHRAVQSLPPDQRRAVLDRVIGERDYEEMAGEYGVSEDVVRARVSRGLRALEAHLVAASAR